MGQYSRLLAAPLLALCSIVGFSQGIANMVLYTRSVSREEGRRRGLHAVMHTLAAPTVRMRPVPIPSLCASCRFARRFPEALFLGASKLFRCCLRSPKPAATVSIVTVETTVPPAASMDKLHLHPLSLPTSAAPAGTAPEPECTCSSGAKPPGMVPPCSLPHILGVKPLSPFDVLRCALHPSALTGGLGKDQGTPACVPTRSTGQVPRCLPESSNSSHSSGGSSWTRGGGFWAAAAAAAATAASTSLSVRTNSSPAPSSPRASSPTAASVVSPDSLPPPQITTPVPPHDAAAVAPAAADSSDDAGALDMPQAVPMSPGALQSLAGRRNSSPTPGKCPGARTPAVAAAATGVSRPRTSGAGRIHSIACRNSPRLPSSARSLTADWAPRARLGAMESSAARPGNGRTNASMAASAPSAVEELASSSSGHQALEEFFAGKRAFTDFDDATSTSTVGADDTGTTHSIVSEAAEQLLRPHRHRRHRHRRHHHRQVAAADDTIQEHPHYRRHATRDKLTPASDATATAPVVDTGSEADAAERAHTSLFSGAVAAATVLDAALSATSAVPAAEAARVRIPPLPLPPLRAPSPSSLTTCGVASDDGSTAVTSLSPLPPMAPPVAPPSHNTGAVGSSCSDGVTCNADGSTPHGSSARTLLQQPQQQVQLPTQPAVWGSMLFRQQGTAVFPPAMSASPAVASLLSPSGPQSPLSPLFSRAPLPLQQVLLPPATQQRNPTAAASSASALPPAPPTVPATGEPTACTIPPALETLSLLPPLALPSPPPPLRPATPPSPPPCTQAAPLALLLPPEPPRTVTPPATLAVAAPGGTWEVTEDGARVEVPCLALPRVGSGSDREILGWGAAAARTIDASSSSDESGLSYLGVGTGLYAVTSSDDEDSTSGAAAATAAAAVRGFDSVMRATGHVYDPALDSYRPARMPHPTAPTTTTTFPAAAAAIAMSASSEPAQIEPITPPGAASASSGSGPPSILYAPPPPEPPPRWDVTPPATPTTPALAASAFGPQTEEVQHQACGGL